MKTPNSLLAIAILALASPVTAQQVVFAEGFESGLSNWTATGLWNLEDSSDPCGSQVSPFVEGTKAAWYGSPTSCTYDTGSANSGTLIMNDWLDLPVAPSLSIHFWMWSHSEYCWADSYGTQYDVYSVRVYRQTGSPTSVSTFLCNAHSGPASTLLPWHERRVDITAFAGQRIKIEFAFGTGDQLSNAYPGWFVDNIEVMAEPGVRICPAAGQNSGCPCSGMNLSVAGGCRNSTGQSATLFSEGSISVATDSLLLRVEHMPPSASAILTQAMGFGSSIVFGDGIRCVAGSLMRMGQVFASGGVATWPPAGTDPISIRGNVPASGGTRYYYVFYRDVIEYCTPAAYNLTEMVRINWVP